MNVICTFPGKYGDLLWALPTVRALSRNLGHPVDLALPIAMASIVPLLEMQPYIGVVWTLAKWEVENTAPASPRVPPFDGVMVGPQGVKHYDQTIHLGHRQWPECALPFEVLNCYISHRLGSVELQQTLPVISQGELDLKDPWITLEPNSIWDSYHWPWLYGFTDEHFELKSGLVQLLERSHRKAFGRTPNRIGLPPTAIGFNPRWTEELGVTATSWFDSAALLKSTDVLLACNSALHVLAVAMGVPVVMMEPNPHRHHPIFYPLGTTGPQVTLVRGTDGIPTFDARHVWATLAAVLAERIAARVDSPASPSQR